VARDVGVLLLLGLFAWFGWTVYQVVDEVGVLGRGVASAGDAVQEGFSSVAGTVRPMPLVGATFADALEGAGSGTGGTLSTLGREGEATVHRVARWSGMLVFGLPALFLLLLALPGRARQIRSLTAAGVVLAHPDDAERRRLVAMRAAFGLPYGSLLAYTRDPLGDLVAERYDGLVAAALADAGLRERKAQSARSVS